MRQVCRYTALALVCCAITQVRVVAVAQGERPRVAIGNAGSAVATKPGEADGASSPALTGERRPLYRLHKSDVVEIQFDIVPEFNQIQGIQPDGFLALRDCAPIAAEGMTLAELQDAVGKAYADTLNDPKITIILKDFDKPYFIATGEVLRPGKYELRADTTVAEGLAIAGGLNGQAKHSQVVLFRHVSADRVESHLIDVKRMLKSRDLEEDIHLKPGDFLFVPQNTISKIRKFMPASNLGMYWNGAQY